MLEIPIYIHLVFIATSFLAIFLISGATWNGETSRVKNRTLPVAFLSIMWLLFISILALQKYFLNTTTLPPHLAIPVVMTGMVILLIFLLKRGRTFIDGLSLKWLTWLHVIRIPVEFVLFWLAGEKLIPHSMTFGGLNFDILSGLTAPLIAYFHFNRNWISRKGLLIWNIVALGLVLAVMTNGVLSLPSPIQQFNFDQPNRAVLQFPFAWLPAYIVPLVIFSHLVALRRLTKKKTS